MIDSIIHEIANVGITLLIAVFVIYIIYRIFSINLFGNFRFDDSDLDNDEDY
jgi:hypothetical protein